MSTSSEPQWLPTLPLWGCACVVLTIVGALAFAAWGLHQVTLESRERDARYQRSLVQDQVDAVLQGDSRWLHLYDFRNAALIDEMLGKLNGATALEHLSFDGADFTDAGIEQLTDLPNLTTLKFHASPITDRQLRHLADHLKSVKHLSLESTFLTDEGMAALKSFPKLESLSVWTGDHGLSDAALERFAELENLKELTLLGDWFSDGAVEELRKKLPNCDIEVRVKGYESIREAPLKAGSEN